MGLFGYKEKITEDNNNKIRNLAAFLDTNMKCD